MTIVRIAALTAALTLLSVSPHARSDAAPAAPAGTEALDLAKGSTLWLDGDSTLHKYRLDAKELQVAPQMATGAAPGGAGLEALAAKGGLKGLDVHVAVRGLSSGESGLDDNLRKALSADQYHEIRFQMDSYQSAAGPESGSLALKIKGRLQIAAAEKPIELDAVGVSDGQVLHVTGVKQLLMSDYGIKPPKFMLGAMSVRDSVTIHFDLRLATP